LSGIALTDHDSFEGIPEMRSEAERMGLVFVPGMEITTAYGHVLCLFIQEKVRSKGFLEVVDEVKQQGGIASLAHPFRSSAPKKLLDCVEILNGRTSFEKNSMAVELVKAKKPSFTAGSDAHWASEIASAFLLADAGDSEELLKAILKKKCGAVGVCKSVFEARLLYNASRIVKYSEKALRKLGWKW